MDVQQSLTDWIPRVQGQYIDMDSAYGAQCWDLAAHWSTTLGLPIVNTGGPGRWPGWAGNMVDGFPQNAAVAAAYELIGPSGRGLPGDIVVWDNSYYFYPSTHVAVLVRDPGGYLTCMSQNSTPSTAGNPYPAWTTGPTTLQQLPRQGLLGFIRPRTGTISLAGSTTASEEDAMALEESDRQLFKEFLDDYFINVKRFDGRNLFDNAERTRQEIAGVAAGVTKLPQTVLFDTRVDGRNVFDWAKHGVAVTLGMRGTSVDVQALASAIVAQLPKSDSEALLDALAARLAK